MNIRKFGVLIFGFILGVVEENLRYSIIHHEAKKGDAKAQEIINQFDEVGTKIEELLQK
jgi:hypothetical protein